jgi:hypothetical protein
MPETRGFICKHYKICSAEKNTDITVDNNFDNTISKQGQNN